jgi:hypothetical protein
MTNPVAASPEISASREEIAQGSGDHPEVEAGRRNHEPSVAGHKRGSVIIEVGASARVLEARNSMPR